MTGPYFIAVDGGNSKTDVLVGDAAGRVRARVRGPGSCPHNIGLAGSLTLLDDLVGRARTAAGLPGDVTLDQACVYIAGADLPVEVERLGAGLRTLGWADQVTVDNDLFALLRTGTAARDAIAVVCGAGINCVGRRRDGRTARFPSLGQISGDWGGGHQLASLALYHAARGEDGRGPATALVPAVARHFGLATVEQVSAAIHLGALPAARVHELSETLFAVAAAGDPVATRLVRRQADEIIALARVAAERLGLLAAPHDVVLGGGVLAARHPLLHDAVLAGIGALAPRATIGLVAEPPVVGAALLALDAMHGGTVPTQIEALLRATLRADHPVDQLVPEQRS